MTPRKPTAATRLYALWLMSRPSQLALIAVVYALGVVVGVAREGPLDAAAAGAGLAVLLAWSLVAGLL